MRQNPSKREYYPHFAIRAVSSWWAYEKGQRGIGSVNGDGRLTLVDTVHLERPPGNVSMFVEPPTVGVFDPGDFAQKMVHEKVKELPPSVVNLPAGSVKLSEGAEPDYCESVVPFFLFSRFDPSWATVIGFRVR